jgi:hypothetical protein
MDSNEQGVPDYRAHMDSLCFRKMIVQLYTWLEKCDGTACCAENACPREHPYKKCSFQGNQRAGFHREDSLLRMVQLNNHL